MEIPADGAGTFKYLGVSKYIVSIAKNTVSNPEADGKAVYIWPLYFSNDR